MNLRKLLFVPALGIAALSLAACGDDGGTGTPTPGADKMSGDKMTGASGDKMSGDKMTGASGDKMSGDKMTGASGK